MAIIKSVDITFKPGFSVITGETGAGKTILLSSLGLLQGKLASDELIREGAERASVEATFTNIDIIIDNEHFSELTISRELIRGKNSICRLNGFKTPVKTLKTLATKLFHSVRQDESHSLTTPHYQRSLIDHYDHKTITVLKENYKKQYQKYAHIKQQLQTLQETDTNNEQLLDFLTFQISDIEKQKFNHTEEDDLKKEKKNLKSHKKYQLQTNTCLTSLATIQEEFYQLEKALQELSEIDPSLSPLLEHVRSIDSNTKDLQETIHTHNQKWKKPELIDINELESRLDVIFRYKNKYNVQTLLQLLDHLEALKLKHQQIIQYDTQKETLETELTKQTDRLSKHGLLLFEARQKAAKNLSSHIEKELSKLNFQAPKINIELSYTPTNSHSEGQDEINFLIAPNIGFSSLPLEKIASGGERSRILLVLQSILQDSTQTGTLIFDEIDTGIGGMTAHTLAKKLHDISQNKQIITITHLPQIAEKADHHYRIQKGIENKQTTTTIHWLENPKLREKEYLRMAGKN